MRAAFDVVIVGGGIGGMALAIALRGSGLGLALVDENAHFSPQAFTYGHDLQPDALAVLARLGLLDRVNQAGAPHPEWVARREGGELLSRWPYSLLQHRYAYSTCVRGHVLRDLMRAALVGRTDLELIVPARLGGLARTAQGWSLRLAGPAGIRTIAATLLVAADGPCSQVREGAGLRADVRRHGQGWTNAVWTRRGMPDETAVADVYYARGTYLGVVSTRPGELVTFDLTDTDDAATYFSRFSSIAEWRREQSRRAPVLEGYALEPAALADITYIPSFHIRAHNWVADNLALLGDSAVAVHAIASQGAGLALTAALVLAETVTRCFARGELSAGALRPFEDRCRPVAERIQILADRAAIGFGSKSALANRLKLRMLRRLDSRPDLMRRIMHAHCDLSSPALRTPGWREAAAYAGLAPAWVAPRG